MADVAAANPYSITNGSSQRTQQKSESQQTSDVLDEIEAKAELAQKASMIAQVATLDKEAVKDKAKDVVKTEVKKQVVRFLLANPWILIGIILFIAILFIILYINYQLKDHASFIFSICEKLGKDECVKQVLNQGGAALQHTAN